MATIAPTETEGAPGLADDLGRHGDSVALVAGDESITYAQLEARVATTAQRLGATRRLVLLVADNTIEAVVTYLAALRGRHPVILAAPDDNAGRDALIAAYDPDVVVDRDHYDVRHPGTTHDLHPDLALLLSTSGSTGTPKLVRLSHNNLVANAAAIAEVLAIQPTDRAITTLPMQYCYGLSVLNSYVFAGASLVLSDLSVLDACFWRLARDRGVTSFAGVAHTFELLDRIGFTGAEIPSLRYLTQAGGPMAAERVTRYARLGDDNGFALVVMYGQTEATARIAYLPPELAASHPTAIGAAVPGGALRIDAPDIDGVGELVYRGANVMLGYAHGPADLASGPTLHELRTGDLGRQNAAGLFEVVGRRSRFIKPFGIRVDLDDLERVLSDRGLDALCTGDDHRLVVGVRDASQVSAARGTAIALLKLPVSHVVVVVVADAPRGASGKPDYAALRRLAESDGVRVVSVRAAFATALGVDPGDHDTFVGLGGDSLSYVEVSISLEDILGVLPPNWHTMPVAALEAMAAPPRRRRLATVDTTLAIRAVAIVLIVGTHAGAWDVQGGAHALIAVAGFNFARFALTARSIFTSAARVAVPSIAWIALVSVFSTKYGWPHVVLLNDVLGSPESVWSFWFVEAIVQISLVLALVFAVPIVSRFERQRPFAVASLAVGVGLCARFDVIAQPSSHLVTWPQELFWICALGWAAARAATPRHRVLVMVVGMIALPGFFSNPTRGLVVLAALIAITWLPTVTVPRFAVRFLSPLAAASLYIYLTHLQLYSALTRAVGPFAATLASLLVGVGAWRVALYLERVVRTRKATGITLTSNKTSAGSAAAS